MFRMKMKSLWSIALFAALLLQTLGLQAPAKVQAQNGSEYGLPAKTQDGVIFHAWNWSFDNITKNLPAIAAAGFKTIQTSPVQPTKENTMTGSYWWLLYQPVDFSVGNTQLGSRDAFKNLCTEAEKYGINIIVDVIVQHTANAGGGDQENYPSSQVNPAIRDNPNFWHEHKKVQNWNDRWQVTHWGIGLPDLNTANQELQDMIIRFLNDAVSLGADGFRFDTAKHVELPGEIDGSNFWPRVLGSLNNKDNLYLYGEVLQGGADNLAGYTPYLNVTASDFGHQVDSAVGFNSSKNVYNIQNYSVGSISPSKLVTWVESHDTYANDKNETTYMNDWQLKMGWALVASRAATTSLFFDRPNTGSKFANRLGDTGSTLWQDPDVVAVNKFHNAMAGQNEYLRPQSNELILIDRGNKGTVIVNLGGDAQINSPTNLADGTYTNQASGGGTFTVSGGRITGSIGGGKIAVLYKTDVPGPTISIDKAEGNFTTDSLTVKMSYSNADSATYSLNGGAETSFSSGQSITFGAGAAFGTAYTLKITAVGASGTVSKTFSFVKQDPGSNPGITVHYYKPSSWSTPNIYYYDDSVSPTKIGSAWPGTSMTSEGDGWYSYKLGSDWSKAYVIFNSNGQQIPASGQRGYLVTGEAWIKDGVITSQKPIDNSLVSVTFNIKNATTVWGQSVYLVGNTAELGNWDTSKAVGPGSSAAYPNWSVTVKLPAGTQIQFKAIKKDASGKVVWEGGSNHTYTVSASNPTVDFYFQN